jgi:hypothetical protein
MGLKNATFTLWALAPIFLLTLLERNLTEKCFARPSFFYFFLCFIACLLLSVFHVVFMVHLHKLLEKESKNNTVANMVDNSPTKSEVQMPRELCKPKSSHTPEEQDTHGFIEGAMFVVLSAVVLYVVRAVYARVMTEEGLLTRHPAL